MDIRKLKNNFVQKGYQYFRSLLTIVSPKLNTKIVYRIKKGKPVDLRNPKTFDEKISWLKLNTYYKNPLVSQCADKYAVREYIYSCGCQEILNDIYGVYDRVEEIPWNSLPEKFVLKWNMGWGCNLLCPDKSKLDIQVAKKKMKKWGKKKYYLGKSEMQYKYIEPKIISERFLEDEDGSIPDDYKIYCFNGVAQYVLVCVGRDKGRPKFYFLDRNWELARINRDSIATSANFTLPKPEGIEKMFAYADILSSPFPFVRADFYYVKGKIYFGELTFTPAGGMDSNRLEETDILFGQMLELPNANEDREKIDALNGNNNQS